MQLGRRDLADPPQTLDGKRVQELELLPRRDVAQAVRLGDLGGHLGEELRPRDPDRDRETHLLAHPLTQPHRDLHRRSGDGRQAADVQERLVDRDAFDVRRGVVEDREHGLAGLDVVLEPGRHHDRLRAQLAGLTSAHRRAHPVRLRLVAGREHDAGADDDRAAAQVRVIALLDRRVERVQVGVQDHVHMFE